jgi:hypothetical protein
MDIPVLFVLLELRAITLPMFALLAVKTLNDENILGFRSARSHHLSLPFTLALRLALGMLLNLLLGQTDCENIPRSYFMSSSAVLSKPSNSSTLFDIPIML